MRTGTATRNSRGSSVVPRPRARRAPTRPSPCWPRGFPADVVRQAPEGDSQPRRSGNLTSSLCTRRRAGPVRTARRRVPSTDDRAAAHAPGGVLGRLARAPSPAIAVGIVDDGSTSGQAEVVTGATDRLRSVDVGGLGALDGGTSGGGRRALTTAGRGTRPRPVPVLIAAGRRQGYGLICCRRSARLPPRVVAAPLNPGVGGVRGGD